MVKFCSILQKTKAAEYWTDIAEKWKNAVENIHYNEEDGIWWVEDEYFKTVFLLLSYLIFHICSQRILFF